MPRARTIKSPVRAAQPRRKRAQVQPPLPQNTGMWLQRYVPEELRLSTEEKLSEATVYGAIRNIAGPLAAAKWVPVIKGNGRRESLGDGNLFYLLNVWPNDDQTPSAIKHALIASALIYGDGYLAINRSDTGQAIALWQLESACVTKVRDPATGILYFRYLQPDGSETFLPGSDVIHLPGPAFNGIDGDSLVDRASPSISLAVAQARFAQSFFANAGVISGYLRFTAPVTDAATIDRIKADWAAKFSGKRANGIAALSGGEFVPVSTDAEKSQLQAAREMSVSDIARVMKVPIVLLSLAISSQGYGNNTTQFFEMYVRTCLHEWKVIIEEEVTRKLCPQRAPWSEVEIDLAYLTRGNAQERATTNEILIRSGQATINECRAEEGRDAVKGGDVLLINGQPLDRVLEPPKPPPALPQPAPQPDQQSEDPTQEQGPQQDNAADVSAEPDVTAMRTAGMALALANHRRRYVARSKDVAEDKLPAARAELRAKLAAEMQPFCALTDDQFAALATQVEAGVEPSKAIATLRD